MWFPAGKVRGEFKEIVHTIATVQTIDVSKLSRILYSNFSDTKLIIVTSADWLGKWNIPFEIHVAVFLSDCY